jgi:hypothetical protein
MKMNKTPNEMQFIYEASNGTKFKCEHSDFSCPVLVKRPKLISREDADKDLIEMAWYHATSVLPLLNGFSGYDVMKLKYVKKINELI